MKQKTSILGLVLLFATALTTNASTFDLMTLTASIQSLDKYKDTYAPVATPSAIGADGTVYQTGLYDDFVEIGDYFLEPVGTSAFIAAIDPATSSAKWAVGIQGNSYIRQIATDGSYVYVAGTFADNITITDVNLNSKAFSGTDRSHKQANAFFAKYSTDGVLVDAFSVIPIVDTSKETAEQKFDEDDLSVTPTALALRGSNIFMSFSYKGGYSFGSFSKYGTIQSAQGLTTGLCVGVLSIPSDNLSGAEKVLDVQGVAKTVNSGLGPNSICLTTTETSVEIGVFMTGECVFDFGKGSSKSTKNYKYNYTSLTEEAGFVIAKLTDSGHSEFQFPGATVEYSYSYARNMVRHMQVSDGKLYIAGNLATGLPLQTSIVPKLWTDQFAACLNAETYEVEWAAITGANRDDMPDTKSKYRETIGAALSSGNYVLVGSTNFSCGVGGVMTPFLASAAAGSSSDTCLGISTNGSSLAVAAEIRGGSQLAVSAPLPSSVEAVETPVSAQPQAIYSVDGTQRASLQKGTINILKYSDGSVKKQIAK